MIELNDGKPIPLFVEVCAGLASVSLMLQYGKHCKPPVSRCGNKHGYGLALLRIMGLRPGQRADSYLLCEPDPGCRALLHAYTDPALMREAADIIRGWKDEDPRALWERLRAEGPIEDFGAREVGRHVLMGVWSYRQSEPESGFIGPGQRRQDTSATATARLADAAELARYLQVTASNRLINIDSNTMRNSGKGGTTHGGSEFATPAGKVADAAREVARHCWTHQGSYQCRGMDAGIGRPEGRPDGGGFGAVAPLGEVLPRTLGRMDTATGLPATIAPDAREVVPPDDLPPGCVVYADFPYLGDGTQKITGYGHELTLDDQRELVSRWDAAGAAVYVSECVDRRKDFGGRFRWSVDITGTRIGQKRSFSTALGKTEWVTCNREPAWRPATQQGLFGAGQ